MFDCQAALASRIASRSQFQCVYRHGRDSTAATLLIAGTASARRFGSRNGSYGISGPRAERPYSGLTLAARITLAHFSVSLAMSLPNSAGVIGIGAPPSSTRRALSLGSARAALISLLSLPMTSAGVPLGAPRPSQR